METFYDLEMTFKGSKEEDRYKIAEEMKKELSQLFSCDIDVNIDEIIDIDIPKKDYVGFKFEISGEGKLLDSKKIKTHIYEHFKDKYEDLEINVKTILK